MYILICPTCGERDDLERHGNTFHCNNCDDTSELEEMDFEYNS